MENQNTTKTPVDIALDEQRRESEVRAILSDLERLETVSVERKRRWVWELIQNAKDCAKRDSTEEKIPVNIYFTIDEGKLTFAHDGMPFNLNEILALVRRTSTKSYDTDEGDTGKFGTGFVTTHVLNKKVNVYGLLENESGLREFSICIDRNPNTILSLQKELSDLFKTINDFYTAPSKQFSTIPLTKYVYELEPEKFRLALESLDEMKRNLPFTLLINPSIKSVTVTDNVNTSFKKYTLSESFPISKDIRFSMLPNGNDDKIQEGLAHYSYDGLTIAVPVEKDSDNWKIKRIENQARLFREFPLVGTENWKIPFFVQSSVFLPSEQRDGVRTFKENETKVDHTADTNRTVFIKFKDAAISFFKIMQEISASDSFLLVESGFPAEKTEYTAKEWYFNCIQKPLRETYLAYPLVKTVAGNPVTIVEAKFPVLFIDYTLNKEFYSISSKYYRDSFPDESSYTDWQRIISQDTEKWYNDLIVNP